MMKKKPEITFNQAILFIINGSEKIEVQMPSIIKQIELLDEVIVVRVHPKGIHFLNENVFGVSQDGKILWQIDKVDHVDEESPYTGLGQEKGLLTAYNWDGFDYLVDPKTGKIIDKKYVK